MVLSLGGFNSCIQLLLDDLLGNAELPLKGNELLLKVEPVIVLCLQTLFELFLHCLHFIAMFHCQYPSFLSDTFQLLGRRVLDRLGRTGVLGEFGSLFRFESSDVVCMSKGHFSLFSFNL